MDASKMIDREIAGLKDWRGKGLAEIRRLIHEALPDVEETWKWMGTACYERGGLLCAVDPHKEWLKITFLHGAALPDPAGLFNAELEGKARRAIRVFEKDRLKAAPFKALIRAAAAHDEAKAKPRKEAVRAAAPAKKARKPAK